MANIAKQIVLYQVQQFELILKIFRKLSSALAVFVQDHLDWNSAFSEIELSYLTTTSSSKKKYWRIMGASHKLTTALHSC